MKKLILFSAVAVLATACARVDAEKTNQNPNFAAQARLAPSPMPINQVPVQQQVVPQGQGQQVNVAPVRPATSTVCVANVIRETKIKEVEKFERIGKEKIRVNPESSVSSRMTTTVKFISPFRNGALVSRERVKGPVTEEPETYDFKKLQITAEDKKIRFLKAPAEKDQPQKYFVNEADLTAQIFADIDFNEPQLIEDGRGYEKTCSFIAKGSFVKDDENKTVSIDITLTETFQLDNKAVSSLLKSARRK